MEVWHDQNDAFEHISSWIVYDRWKGEPEMFRDNFNPLHECRKGEEGLNWREVAEVQSIEPGND